MSRDAASPRHLSGAMLLLVGACTPAWLPEPIPPLLEPPCLQLPTDSGKQMSTLMEEIQIGAPVSRARTRLEACGFACMNLPVGTQALTYDHKAGFTAGAPSVACGRDEPPSGCQPGGEVTVRVYVWGNEEIAGLALTRMNLWL